LWRIAEYMTKNNSAATTSRNSSDLWHCTCVHNAQLSNDYQRSVMPKAQA